MQFDVDVALVPAGPPAPPAHRAVQEGLGAVLDFHHHIAKALGPLPPGKAKVAGPVPGKAKAAGVPEIVAKVPMPKVPPAPGADPALVPMGLFGPEHYDLGPEHAKAGLMAKGAKAKFAKAYPKFDSRQWWMLMYSRMRVRYEGDLRRNLAVVAQQKADMSPFLALQFFMFM